MPHISGGVASVGHISQSDFCFPPHAIPYLWEGAVRIRAACRSRRPRRHMRTANCVSPAFQFSGSCIAQTRHFLSLSLSLSLTHAPFFAVLLVVSVPRNCHTWIRMAARMCVAKPTEKAHTLAQRERERVCEHRHRNGMLRACVCRLCILGPSHTLHHQGRAA